MKSVGGKGAPSKIFAFGKKAAVARGLERQSLQKRESRNQIAEDCGVIDRRESVDSSHHHHVRSLISKRKKRKPVFGGGSGSEQRLLWWPLLLSGQPERNW